MPNENANNVDIIVNGQQKSVPKGDISHFGVVKLGFPEVLSEEEANAYTVTYDRGPSEQQSGILPPGGSIKAKKDMEFDVISTGMS